LATRRVFATAPSALATPRAWSPDNQPLCYGCVKAYDLFRRRHHCRKCGESFCAECCSKQLSGGAEKTCQPCADAVAAAAEARTATALAKAAAAGEGGGAAASGRAPAEAAAQFAAAAEAALAVGGAPPPATGEAAIGRTEPLRPPRIRKVLVLINPFSGKKRAPQVWARVAPLLAGCASLAVEVLLTTHAGHATELLATMPQDQLPDVLVGLHWTARSMLARNWVSKHVLHWFFLFVLVLVDDNDVDVVPHFDSLLRISRVRFLSLHAFLCGQALCSGDGLVFEAVNGLLRRADVALNPALAHRVALVHLPGGTSNGLACSVGTEDPVAAALAIAKHLAVPWDAAAVDVGGGEWTGTRDAARLVWRCWVVACMAGAHLLVSS
jgi:hypothetical protein